MTGSDGDFVYEASGQIERLSDGFVALERDGFDRGTLDDLFRVAHTLKGNCAAAGFEAPATTAHALEDLLDEVRRTPDAFADVHVDTALEALDVLERQLMEIQSTGAVETDASEVVASVEEFVPDASTEATDGADGTVDVDSIELPSVDDGEDISAEEALENAAVFDDLESLEAGVDTDDFDDVEGVGLFDTDDAAVESVETGADAGGVTSSTRRNSDVVPGEDSYAEVLSDTTRAAPDDLQSELEDVTFGEFDDDDDLSIAELVDLAEDEPGGERRATGRDSGRAGGAADTEPGGERRGTSGTDPVDADGDLADDVVEADASNAADVFSFNDAPTTDVDDAPTTDVDDAATTDAEEMTTDDVVLDDERLVDEGTAFEFGPTESESSASDEEAPLERVGESDAGQSERADEVVDADAMAAAGSEAATADSSVAAGAEADAATDDVADDDGTASPSSPAVGEIVERIERLDETAAAADDATATNATDDREATPTRGERFGGSNPESDAADLGLDDELGAAFDAAATVEEPDVTPSDVPDVEAILAETEFDDVEEVEFATAEFYDRVGFETDSSTGAFVSAFDEAFTDDALGVDVDQVRVDADAATTIDPDLLDRATPAPDSGTSSLDAVREVTLDVDEADELLELTEELVVDTQRLAGALPELPPDAADALASLRDVSARIEDQVSNVRLVPLDDAFSGLSRTSRRVARSQDKEVTFLTENGDVEVDRQVVDELADPLVHLVRNAVDHGIEPPDERVEKGKESEGTVLVRAERDGDTVTVAVEDDGRGVAPDDLRAAAVEAGLYTEAEAAALDRDDALALMFDAGLSTTTEVTEVSGRGVGLDVVSDVATRLEGTLDVTSEPDVGTTVELTLPVSVALSEVLTVSVGPRRFGLPATEIRRVEEFAPERVDGETYRLLTGEDTQERVPIVDLADELDVDPAAASTPAYTDVVVLTDGPNPRALRCQDVRDWESVVVQSFDGVLRDHERARGAALAGDGTPVVVLEPAALGGNR